MNPFRTLRLRILAASLLAVLFSLCSAGWLLLRAGAVTQEALRAHAPQAFGLAALAAFAAAWVITALLARQFGEIIEGSKHFAGGEFDYRIPVGSSGELRRLTETLNFMAGELGAKVREADLRRLELEAAFREMPEAIVVTDGSGVILRMNARARQLMGVKGFEPEGMRLSGMPGGGPLSSAAIKALSSGEAVRLETEPGPGVTLEVAASPLFEGGMVRGCVLTARDVSGPRRLEELRKEFVANVSHELRTPLTAIKGSAETLLDGALGDKEHGPVFARSIYDQALRLERLVADLLTVSHAESGRLKPDLAPQGLRALADEAAAGLKAVFAGRGISFSNAVPEDLVAAADRGKLLQVFTNLLDNAAKYNREGGSVKVLAAEEGGFVKLAVEDDGPGIAAVHLPHLFERFYRADKARSRELGGTGLGLSIVKHLVELHGGACGVDSAEGRGSAFWFTLPK